MENRYHWATRLVPFSLDNHRPGALNSKEEHQLRLLFLVLSNRATEYLEFSQWEHELGKSRTKKTKASHQPLPPKSILGIVFFDDCNQ